jgi:hypothetical protein
MCKILNWWRMGKDWDRTFSTPKLWKMQRVFSREVRERVCKLGAAKDTV